MTTPINPVPPVNNLITIQPVATTIPNREQGGGTNPLSALPQGTTVQGFVVNRDAQSNPILRTPLGDLRITSEVFLKTGSEVIFRVDNSQSSLARIVTVDGLSPQDYSASSARGLTRDTITPSGLQGAINTNPTAQAGNVAVGNPSAAPVLQAIVLQGAAAHQTPSLLANTLAAAQSGPLPIVAQLALLRAGAALKLTVLDLKFPPLPIGLSTVPNSSNLASLLTPPRPAIPSAAPPPTSQPAPAASPLPQTAPPALLASIPTPAAPSSVPTSSALPTSPPAVGPLASSATPHAFTAVQNNAAPTAYNPQSNAPPASPTAPATIPTTQTLAPTQAAIPELTKPTAPNQIVATVIGHDADGGNILNTPFASLKVYTPQPLPTGTTLLVQAEFNGTIATPNTPSQSILSTITAPTAPTQNLTVFAETIAWLQANQPDVAQDVAQRVPNISHQLVNGLLNYIIGVRLGDVGEIIGKRALRLLEISNPELLSRLRQQVEQLQGNFVDGASSQWNALSVPLFFGGEVHAAKLFIHKEPPEESKNSGENGHGQRFILEVEMSQLGSLQFDGFVRTHERGKSFDLMVRSNELLPAEISNGIRDIFSNSMEATRMHGQVIFQPGQQHFVKPDAPSSPFSSTRSNTILA